MPHGADGNWPSYAMGRTAIHDFDIVGLVYEQEG